MSAFELVREINVRKRLYKLAEPITWPRLMADGTIRDDVTEHVITSSFGRSGDSQIFPATADGEIADFWSFHGADYWIDDHDEFMSEWLVTA